MVGIVGMVELRIENADDAGDGATAGAKNPAAKEFVEEPECGARKSGSAGGQQRLPSQHSRGQGVTLPAARASAGNREAVSTERKRRSSGYNQMSCASRGRSQHPAGGSPVAVKSEAA